MPSIRSKSLYLLLIGTLFFSAANFSDLNSFHLFVVSHPTYERRHLAVQIDIPAPSSMERAYLGG
jgi:hypothetical protein